MPWVLKLVKPDIKASGRTWGLLPADVRRLVLKREWHSEAGLKARLLNHKPFPIRVGLKPPKGRSAIADINHFQLFVKSWQNYDHQRFIQWEVRAYRVLSEQTVPRFLVLNSIQDLLEFVGTQAAERSQVWLKNMAPLLKLSEGDGANIYPVLVKYLGTIEVMEADTCQLLADLIRQLSADMGVGLYLRALPLIGVDTKFLEQHQNLITELLDVLHPGQLSASSGLLDWLGCLDNPKGWLCVRPLCESVKAKMGGLPIMQLPLDVLRQYELPATNILVVENLQSGLGLPSLPETIAVFGGGKNVAWMNAVWLAKKRVAYWGDIDTWGLSFLSDARAKFPSLTPLMMDIQTIRHFEDRMVNEAKPVGLCPEYLSETEKQIFSDLKSGEFHASRLEQERLSRDYIDLNLQAWLRGTLAVDRLIEFGKRVDI